MLLLMLVALKGAQGEDHLDVILVNKGLLFQEKNLIK